MKISSRGDSKPYEFLPVVGVYICDFKIKGVDERLSNFYMFSNTESGSILTASLRSAYIQLPYFDKEWEECETKFDQWVFILKNMYKLDEFPEMTRKDEIFARLEEVASYAALTEEEKVDYEADLRWVSEYEEEMRSARRVATEEGRAEGLKKGLEEGRAEGLAEGIWLVAKNLYSSGMSLEDISKNTGLTINDLQSRFS